MTELEAVNAMLLSIGKAPVNSLTTITINDVAWAVTCLNTVCREVQHRGWWFNLEPHYHMTPTVVGGQNIVQRPTSALDWTTSYRDQPLVERYNSTVGALCLYDNEKHTFDITRFLNQADGTLHVDIVWCFPFEQLPHAARSYIARRAGREFQISAVGSQILYQFTKEMELDAMAELERSETNDSHTNIFATPNRTNRAFNRQRGYRRTW